ncbi:hypothetical protein ABVT39_003319 [Epinephelus coioides]
MSVVKEDLKIDSGRTPKADDADEYAAAAAFKRWDGFGAYAGAGLDHKEGGAVKGPNVGAGAEISLTEGARAVVNAELISVSASAGPAKATLGLSAETGGTISPTQVEAKVLGTGFSLGRKMGVSFLGTGFEFKLW